MLQSKMGCMIPLLSPQKNRPCNCSLGQHWPPQSRRGKQPVINKKSSIWRGQRWAHAKRKKSIQGECVSNLSCRWTRRIWRLTNHQANTIIEREIVRACNRSITTSITHTSSGDTAASTVRRAGNIRTRTVKIWRRCSRDNAPREARVAFTTSGNINTVAISWTLHHCKNMIMFSEKRTKRRNPKFRNSENSHQTKWLGCIFYRLENFLTKKKYIPVITTHRRCNIPAHAAPHVGVVCDCGAKPGLQSVNNTADEELVQVPPLPPDCEELGVKHTPSMSANIPRAEHMATARIWAKTRFTIE